MLRARNLQCYKGPSINTFCRAHGFACNGALPAAANRLELLQDCILSARRRGEQLPTLI